MAIQTPCGLGERGQMLWDDMSTGDSARDSVVLEAARTVDRLDELDSIIQGKGVLNLMQFRVLSSEMAGDGVKAVNVEVKFQSVLAEARQQAMALAGLLKSVTPGEAAKPQSVVPFPSNVSPLQRLNQKLNG
ncbi:hypothetical protein [Arthrobacter sp. MDT1-65]